MMAKRRERLQKAPKTNILTKAARCRRGIAATEFALLLPVQILLFFGLIEASDAMTVNRRVALASNTLADLVAQSKELTEGEADSLFVGVREILGPNGASGLTLNLVSVVPDVRGDPIVHWSRDLDGREPYGRGGAFTRLTDATTLTAGSSLIVAEIEYSYTPTLTRHVLSTSILFKRQTIRWPRLSTRVQLCKAPGVGCTT